MKRRPISKNTRQKVYERDGHKCLKCGSSADLTLDHIIPIRRGGTSRLANLQTLCFECNNEKGIKMPKKGHGECIYEYREAIGLPRKPTKQKNLTMGDAFPQLKKLVIQ